jgi:hypothetical protein
MCVASLAGGSGSYALDSGLVMSDQLTTRFSGVGNAMRELRPASDSPELNLGDELANSILATTDVDPTAVQLLKEDKQDAIVTKQVDQVLRENKPIENDAMHGVLGSKIKKEVFKKEAAIVSGGMSLEGDVKVETPASEEKLGDELEQSITSGSSVDTAGELRKEDKQLAVEAKQVDQVLQENKPIKNDATHGGVGSKIKKEVFKKEAAIVSATETQVETPAQEVKLGDELEDSIQSVADVHTAGRLAKEVEQVELEDKPIENDATHGGVGSKIKKEVLKKEAAIVSAAESPVDGLPSLSTDHKLGDTLVDSIMSDSTHDINKAKTKDALEGKQVNNLLKREAKFEASYHGGVGSKIKKHVFEKEAAIMNPTLANELANAVSSSTMVNTQAQLDKIEQRDKIEQQRVKAAVRRDAAFGETLQNGASSKTATEVRQQQAALMNSPTVPADPIPVAGEGDDDLNEYCTYCVEQQTGQIPKGVCVKTNPVYAANGDQEETGTFHCIWNMKEYAGPAANKCMVGIHKCAPAPSKTNTTTPGKIEQLGDAMAKSMSDATLNAKSFLAQKNKWQTQEKKVDAAIKKAEDKFNGLVPQLAKREVKTFGGLIPEAVGNKATESEDFSSLVPVYVHASETGTQKPVGTITLAMENHDEKRMATLADSIEDLNMDLEHKPVKAVNYCKLCTGHDTDGKAASSVCVAKPASSTGSGEWECLFGAGAVLGGTPVLANQQCPGGLRHCDAATSTDNDPVKTPGGAVILPPSEKTSVYCGYCNGRNQEGKAVESVCLIEPPGFTPNDPHMGMYECMFESKARDKASRGLCPLGVQLCTFNTRKAASKSQIPGYVPEVHTLKIPIGHTPGGAKIAQQYSQYCDLCVGKHGASQRADSVCVQESDGLQSAAQTFGYQCLFSSAKRMKATEQLCPLGVQLCRFNTDIQKYLPKHESNAGLQVIYQIVLQVHLSGR